MKAKLSPALKAAIAMVCLFAVRDTVHSHPAALTVEAAHSISTAPGFRTVRRFFSPRYSSRRRPGALGRVRQPYPGRPLGGRSATTNPGRWWSRHRPAKIDAGPIVIAGAGGNRPAISPSSSLSYGQQPSTIAAALLNGKRYRARELLIEVPNASADQLKRVFAAQYGVRIREVGVIVLINARIWHLTLVRNQNLRDILRRLLRDNRVLKAQPNYIYTPVQGALPQATNKASAAPASVAATGRGVKIAIIDTCLDRHHIELQGSVAAYYDALSSSARDCAPEDHGTAVASLIAGHGQIHGSAMAATLLSARAFTVAPGESEFTGTSSEIVLSVDWSARAGAQVANLSFAGPSDPLLERTLAAAYRKGIVLVAAAGNSGPSSPPLYPAAYPEVIAVTAFDARHRLYGAANSGAHLAVSARGVDVLVAKAGNAYGTETGTSFAAATVSGVTALMREMRPKASPDEIRSALVTTAAAVTGAENSGLSGHGLLDASAAVAFVVANVSQ